MGEVTRSLPWQQDNRRPPANFPRVETWNNSYNGTGRLADSRGLSCGVMPLGGDRLNSSNRRFCRVSKAAPGGGWLESWAQFNRAAIRRHCRRRPGADWATLRWRGGRSAGGLDSSAAIARHHGVTAPTRAGSSGSPSSGITSPTPRAGASRSSGIALGATNSSSEGEQRARRKAADAMDAPAALHGQCSRGLRSLGVYLAEATIAAVAPSELDAGPL